MGSENGTGTAYQANPVPDANVNTGDPLRDPILLRALEWRLIGPHRGGRVTAVVGHPSDPMVFYFGACAGGVWKTTDGGRYWENITDGFLQTGAVGAMAVSISDPDIIYVGMGETTIRGNVSHGDGVYKSTDGGGTWQHLGLEQTRHIAKVRIHPNNPNLVYVAALGHVYGPNEERGIYRSEDGGTTWEKILFRSNRAGAVDLSLDPEHPQTLYATFWEAQRSPYSLTSGGPDSSLYKSMDGGDSWTEITNNSGLPTGIKGKIGVVVSPAKHERVWALVEATNGGLFRSDDGGATWQRISEDRRIWQRPWYFMHVFADPQDPETIWILNVICWKSTDGGRTFSAVPTPFEDQHDLWIDPRDPRRVIEGNDGGACVSFNGGSSWSSQYNQPTAQFYHVTADNQVPYRLYGAQQDINTLSIPSRSDNAAITAADWYTVGGGESGYIAVRPDDANIVYAGSFGGHITHYDHRTRQMQDISAWPDDPMGWAAKDLKYRFQWTFPIVISPHDPDVLYITSNVVHRSSTAGMQWEAVSPDLTRNDISTLQSSGGPIKQDNVSTEYYGTIFSFAESPRAAGTLWSGSDDGLIHVSRDGGITWENVTPAEMPEWALISIIEPSPHDAATAYVAATCYKLDDFAPYLYKTNDYGKTWTKITHGIRRDDFTRVIREDPSRQGLLYAGTETGVYVSFDDGDRWQSLQLNLPVTPIHDLIVKDNDLVVATHGRSLWILDDLTPLHQVKVGVWDNAIHLFTPRPTIRFKTFHGFSLPAASGKNSRLVGPVHVTYVRTVEPSGAAKDIFLDAGTNPPNGVFVSYYVKEANKDVTLAFLDGEGRTIKTFSSARENEEQPQHLPTEAGMQRFLWDMRSPDATAVRGATFWAGGAEGAVMPPGRYQVRLTAAGESQTRWFDIRKDPRLTISQEDLEAQFTLLTQIRDTLSAVHDAVNQISDLRQLINDWEDRAEVHRDIERTSGGAQELQARLDAIDLELIERSQDLPYHSPIRLNAKLAALAIVVSSADTQPTQQSYEVFDELSAQVKSQLMRLNDAIAKEVADFKSLIRKE